jgi:hypothetical protein
MPSIANVALVSLVLLLAPLYGASAQSIGTTNKAPSSGESCEKQLTECKQEKLKLDGDNRGFIKNISDLHMHILEINSVNTTIEMKGKNDRFSISDPVELSMRAKNNTGKPITIKSVCLRIPDIFAKLRFDLSDMPSCLEPKNKISSLAVGLSHTYEWELPLNKSDYYWLSFDYIYTILSIFKPGNYKFGADLSYSINGATAYDKNKNEPSNNKKEKPPQKTGFIEELNDIKKQNEPIVKSDSNEPIVKSDSKDFRVDLPWWAICFWAFIGSLFAVAAEHFTVLYLDKKDKFSSKYDDDSVEKSMRKKLLVLFGFAVCSSPLIVAALAFSYTSNTVILIRVFDVFGSIVAGAAVQTEIIMLLKLKAYSRKTKSD